MPIARHLGTEVLEVYEEKTKVKKQIKEFVICRGS